MIDVFAESVGIEMNLVNFKAITGQGMEQDELFFLSLLWTRTVRV